MSDPSHFYPEIFHSRELGIGNNMTNKNTMGRESGLLNKGDLHFPSKFLLNTETENGGELFFFLCLIPARALTLPSLYLLIQRDFLVPNKT